MFRRTKKPDAINVIQSPVFSRLFQQALFQIDEALALLIQASEEAMNYSAESAVLAQVAELQKIVADRKVAQTLTTLTRKVA